MKPLQYAVAIERGYQPCQPIVYTAPSCGQGSWDPKGTDNWEENAIVPMQYGLWYSDNRITANLMCDFGPDALVDMAKRLSIESYLEAVPALCLGVSDISLFEMVGAYTAFANLGIHAKPIFIKKITDKKGNILAAYGNKVNEALPENVAYQTTEMLKGAVNKGTATRLRSRYGLTSEAIAGKTGTTQNNADAWFIGYTPQLVVGCWVGFDQPSIHFATSSSGQGSVAALPIVGSFLRKSYNNSKLGLDSNKPFPYPTDSTFSVNFNCTSAEQADTIKKLP
jgi:penicillin-binding protein 1A